MSISFTGKKSVITLLSINIFICKNFKLLKFYQLKTLSVDIFSFEMYLQESLSVDILSFKIYLQESLSVDILSVEISCAEI